MTLYPYNIKKTELSASETKTFPQNQTLLDMLTDAIEDEISDFGKYISLSEIISNKDDPSLTTNINTGGFLKKYISLSQELLRILQKRVMILKLKIYSRSLPKVSSTNWKPSSYTEKSCQPLKIQI